jgi:hypothetical protein
LEEELSWDEEEEPSSKYIYIYISHNTHFKSCSHTFIHAAVKESPKSKEVEEYFEHLEDDESTNKLEPVASPQNPISNVNSEKSLATEEISTTPVAMVGNVEDKKKVVASADTKSSNSLEDDWDEWE